MALATSIKFNEKDVRSAFGLEVMDIQGIGTSRTNVGAIETFGMPGAKAGISKHGAKGIKLTGYIEGTSHSNLLAKIDSMNKEISFGYHGLQTLRLTISDYTDRYYEARCLDVKITPIHPRFNSFFVNVEIMFGIDDPYALYNVLALEGVAAYLTSTISLSVDIGGSAIARPRIRIYNDGTTLTIYIFIQSQPEINYRPYRQQRKMLPLPMDAGGICMGRPNLQGRIIQD